MAEGGIAFLVFLLTINTTANSISMPLIEKVLNYYKPHPRNAEGIPYDTNRFMSEYDFIVVGGGTAGCVMANRLSEIPGWQILLLEAGSDELVSGDLPLFVSALQLTHLNWGFRTRRQNGMCGANVDGLCHWPRGKVLGGSSAINFMIYTRGHPKDYDSWEEQGNPGWGFNDVLKYFKKSENAYLPGVAGGGDGVNSPYHSTAGYLDVQYIPYRTPLAEAYIKAAKEIGLGFNADYNGGSMKGMSYLQATMRNGSRVSSSKAFLRPVRNRPNLHVSKRSHVTRIVVDPKTKRATGVEFLKDGKRFAVKAKKEVILSAGAIQSPQILMLSGIGPKKHLEQKGIKVLMDLPGVGENLMDHLTFTGMIFTIERKVSLVMSRIFNFKTLDEYGTQKTGPFTIPGGVEMIGYMSSSANATEEEPADVELLILSASLASDDGALSRISIAISDAFYEEYFRPINSRDAWSLLPLVMRPRSRGSVKLRNADPKAWPLMTANYFSDPRDLDIIVAALQRAKSLSQTGVMKELGAKLYDRPIPGCKKHKFGSDEYWRCGVRQLTTPLHHQCGTAKMGPESDSMAVVDASLRVHGIENLRVVDASIIPTIVSAHLYAPVVMIAEKAADMIKLTWRAF